MTNFVFFQSPTNADLIPYQVGPELAADVFFGMICDNNQNQTKKSLVAIHGTEQWHLTFVGFEILSLKTRRFSSIFVIKRNFLTRKLT